MRTLSKRCLLNYENLTLPSFQVIVVAANMGCNRCRDRVSQIISRMTGVSDYTVDVRNKQVSVKGDFRSDWNRQTVHNKHEGREGSRRSPRFFLRCFRATCLNNSLAD